MTADWIDYSRLGWKAFQDLSVTICTEVFGQTVEVFMPQKDGGRDGAFSGRWITKGDLLEGRFCVQCKYTAEQNKPLQATSFLRSELDKIRRLVNNKQCDIYILLTNHSVTFKQKDQIEAVLIENGVKHVRIFSKEWITLQIQKNPQLRMMVPRIYGLGDLAAILDQNAVLQGKLILASMGDELQKFVITNAYRRAAKVLSNRRFVVLLGAPAVGKSTIAACLSLACLDRWKHETIKIAGPSDFVATWIPGSEKRVFWVDDAFGATQLNMDYISEWNQALSHVYAAHKHGCRFIFTSRDYIFNEAKNFLKLGALPVMSESRVIIKVEDLAPKERAQILYNHVKFGDQSRTWRKGIKPHLDYLANEPRFMPELARRLGSRMFTKSLALDLQGLTQFINEPKSFLREVLNGLDRPSLAALGLIFLQGGSLPIPFTLDENSKRFLEQQDVKELLISEALSRLNNSLVRREYERSGTVWKFKHPTISDAYADMVAEDPQKIEYYLRGARMERVLGEVACGGASRRLRIRINVPPALYPIVIDRLSEAEQQSRVNFLAFRCGKLFLNAYLKATGIEPLDFLPKHELLSNSPEVDLFAKLCRYKITTTDEERKYLDHCLSIITADPPESEFFTDERVHPLFHRVDSALYKAKFVDEVLNNLDDRIRSARLDASSEDDIWKLDALKESIEMIKLDPRYVKDKQLDLKVRRLDDYISQLSSDDEEEEAPQDDESLVVKSGYSSTPPPARERSIFDDVDT